MKYCWLEGSRSRVKDPDFPACSCMQLCRHGASSVVLRSQSRYASGDQSASDFFRPAHDGANTSNRGLVSMIGNHSLRCGLIDQTRALRTKC